jgi:hypothetical protein
MESSRTIPAKASGQSHNPSAELPAELLEALRSFAARYVWWMTPDEAVLYPYRVAAQVMNLGTFEDAVVLQELLGDGFLRHVLLTAEAGLFDDRSWHYWHYRLGLAEYGVKPVPPMPARKTA